MAADKVTCIVEFRALLDELVTLDLTLACDGYWSVFIAAARALAYYSRALGVDLMRRFPYVAVVACVAV